MTIGPAFLAVALLPCLTWGAPDDAPRSACHGTPASGRLENGVQLPVSGPNFTSYTRLGALAGRTFVHSTVHEIVVESYEKLEKKVPRNVFVLGETGFRSGGPFPPHKTHQNGLSVDFMVPVIDASGKSVPLPTGPLNRFGYDIEFDQEGRHDGLTIDFEAISAHLQALSEAATSRGVGISRVIFAPELRARLPQTKSWPHVRNHISFWKGKPWVRHDEHYHVDFAVPCKPLLRAQPLKSPSAKPRRPTSRGTRRATAPCRTVLRGGFDRVRRSARRNDRGSATSRWGGSFRNHRAVCVRSDPRGGPRRPER